MEVAQTPAAFWKPSQFLKNIILAGNFSDGRINAYDEPRRLELKDQNFLTFLICAYFKFEKNYIEILL